MISRHSIRLKRPRALPGAVFVCAFWIGAALAGPEDLTERARGTATVLTGDTLAIDGFPEVRLAGVRAPYGRAETFGAPFAADSRDGLAQLLSGHQVSIRPIAVPEDREGAVRAQVLRDDGLWLQGELVQRGLVRVALSADSADFGDELLALEREARAAKRGLWALNAYAVRAASDLDRVNRDVGTYQLIAGTVASTARRGDQIYLNFGADYREDMTAMIPREAWTAFNKIKPLALTGRKIQVRGWVMRQNGPAVMLTTPALLEVLDADQQPAPPPKKPRKRAKKAA